MSSYTARPPSAALPSHLRSSSGLSHPSASTTQTSILQNRIQEKRLELENLQQLRHLSAGLAGQMQQLENKLATLSDGTQAVAEVLGNWNAVLRAIYMASTVVGKTAGQKEGGEDAKEGEGEENAEKEELPQTLVRIPIQQAQAAQREAEAAVEAAGE